MNQRRMNSCRKRVFALYEGSRLSLSVIRSEKGFNASQRADPRLRRFMSNLAHFTLGSLNDLISEDFFNVDDYVDVKFIAPSKNTKLSSFRFGFCSVLTADYDENHQQVSAQHQRLVSERNLLLRSDSHRRTWFVLHVQLEDSRLSLA